MVLQHTGYTKTFDFAKNCLYSAYYIVYYEGVKFETKPVTNGFRLALVYDMVRYASW